MKDADGRQVHLRLLPGDIGRYVLLPGDPGRCEKIASHFDAPRFVAANREYVTYSGTLLGKKVSVTSTGIGCPSAAIAVEELIAVGADTFIRVGTSGAVQTGFHTGDLAVVTAAIRDEGTSLHYLPVEFPAVADLDVVLAMREGARNAGLPFHLGVSHSKDSFYGEIEPGRMPVAERLQERWKAWQMGGAVCSEMEAAAIFILASIYGKRAGGVMLMAQGSAEAGGEDPALFDVNRPIRAAVEGLKVLIERDRKKEAEALLLDL